jgi:hypothetical protein
MQSREKLFTAESKISIFSLSCFKTKFSFLCHFLPPQRRFWKLYSIEGCDVCQYFWITDVCQSLFCHANITSGWDAFYHVYITILYNYRGIGSQMWIMLVTVTCANIESNINNYTWFHFILLVGGYWAYDSACCRQDGGNIWDIESISNI